MYCYIFNCIINTSITNQNVMFLLILKIEGPMDEIYFSISYTKQHIFCPHIVFLTSQNIALVLLFNQLFLVFIRSFNLNNIELMGN